VSLEYEAIRRYYTTVNAPDGSVLDFVANHERLGVNGSRMAAIKDGFKTWGHDDFNIAVWDNERLVSWDWMELPIEAPEDLPEIARMLAAS
jgi:hypothetical protein